MGEDYDVIVFFGPPFSVSLLCRIAYFQGSFFNFFIDDVRPYSVPNSAYIKHAMTFCNWGFPN